MSLTAWIGFIVWIVIVLAIFVILYWTYPSVSRARKIDRHEYAMPAVFKDSEEWQLLIQSWRELEKMDSWKSETKIAEEHFRLHFRDFIREDINSGVFTNYAIQLAAHNAKVLIDTHYETFDLDKSLALRTTLLLHRVIYDEMSGVLQDVARDFNDIHHLCDRESREYAMQAFKRLREEHLGLADNLPIEMKNPVEELQ